MSLAHSIRFDWTAALSTIRVVIKMTGVKGRAMKKFSLLAAVSAMVLASNGARADMLDMTFSSVSDQSGVASTGYTPVTGISGEFILTGSANESLPTNGIATTAGGGYHVNITSLIVVSFTSSQDGACGACAWSLLPGSDTVNSNDPDFNFTGNNDIQVVGQSGSLYADGLILSAANDTYAFFTPDGGAGNGQYQSATGDTGAFSSSPDISELQITITDLTLVAQNNDFIASQQTQGGGDVPEPMTMAVLGTALFGLGAARRKSA